ncbi:Gcn5-related N-acetyltransferase (GNAT) domain [Trypanosoma melophagium]|uniref:Gcn5-related N-acetyltransferase (GNAT) domain n=1 Tax=Trypanosoma melophagium TaxID=715481 RepID=UPI00351A42BE|nr:Gcn5-related N-acetyltransferase (GNAT) domain [Trypanosoma melophagium]
MPHTTSTTSAVLDSTTSPSLLPLLNLPNGVTAWDGDRLEDERRLHNTDGHADRLMQTINILGVRSKEAQSLNTVLTSVARLRENRQSRLYLACHDGRGVGILKVGVKKLFITHPSHHALVEIDPLCVLDFFVETSCQRQGFGKMLFDFMLTHEGLRPEEVAIDRPSVKFLSFLRKYYGLVEYTPQSNNFVVFHRYFDRWQPQGRQHRSLESLNPGATTTSVRQQQQQQQLLLLKEQREQSQLQSQLQQQQQRRNKTAYELQYEAYVREQAYRAKQHQTETRGMSPAKPVSSSEICAASCAAKRRTSPTRSGVPYNIISGAPAH